MPPSGFRSSTACETAITSVPATEPTTTPARPNGL